MKPLLVGCWDGVNAWLQWEDESPEAGYQVEARLRLPPRDGVAPEWGPWRRHGGLKPIKRSWLVIHTHREGSAIQARVAAFGAAEWQPAMEANFLRSKCTLEIHTEQRRVHYPAGARFHGVVDGCGASYQIAQEVELMAGETALVAAVAVDPSGYHQLDRAGHLAIRPALGLTIRNTAASEDDLSETGRDFSVLTRLPRTTPLTMTLGATNHFDGSGRPPDAANQSNLG